MSVRKYTVQIKYGTGGIIWTSPEIVAMNAENAILVAIEQFKLALPDERHFLVSDMNVGMFYGTSPKTEIP